MEVKGNISREIGLGEVSGKVIISVPKGTDYVELSPDEARQLGEAMCRSAYHAHYGIAPDARASIVSETVRTKLITRLTHIIGDLTGKKLLPGRIAVECVDTVLSEVSR